MFYVPENAKDLLEKYGNKELYDNQRDNFDQKGIEETKLNHLIALIHELKKGLEQEVFIKIKKLCPKSKI